MGAIQKPYPAWLRCAQALYGHFQPGHPAEHPGKHGCGKAVARRMLGLKCLARLCSHPHSSTAHLKSLVKKTGISLAFLVSSRRHATDGVIGVATDQTLSTKQPPVPPHSSQVGEGLWGYSPSLPTWNTLGGTQQCFIMPENCPQAASLCLLPPGSSMRIQPELSGVSITPSPSS